MTTAQPMTTAQKCTSVLMIGHVIAVLVLAIPWRDNLSNADPAANPVPGRMESALRAVHALARPIRPGAEFYESATRLSQRWSMFSVPYHSNLYAHVRFVVDEGGQAESHFARVHHLVSPVQPEDSLRVRGAFAASYRSKAIERGIYDYRLHLATPGGSLAMEERHAHFARLLRLLSTQLEPEWHRYGSLVRAEMWMTVVPMTPPGQQSDFAERAHIRRTIDRYFEGWADTGRGLGDTPLLGTREFDGVLQWTFCGAYETARS